MGGGKIIDGLRDAIAFLGGDATRARVTKVATDGTRADVTGRWLAERGIAVTRRPGEGRATGGDGGSEPE